MDFYHVLNRGVEKRDVVIDDGDRQRFVRSLYVFNDTKSAPNSVSQAVQWDDAKRSRDVLVHLHAWCLMNNHYHLLLSPKDDDVKNISKFMRKLNMGYAKFFNEKYGRSGYLWQGRYKKILIKRDGHFLHIPYYIHLNPLDYTYPQWRTGQVIDTEQAYQSLLDYRWSSFLDYNQQHNFPSLIIKNVFSDLLGDSEVQHREIKKLISGGLLADCSKELET